jgi:O-antigen ligase
MRFSLILNYLKGLTHQKIGAFLALLIVVFLPNYGIDKYGPSPVVPAALLCLLGIWLVAREKGALFASTAQRRWLLIFLLLVVPVLLSIPGSFKRGMSINIALVLALYFFTGVALIRSLVDEALRSWLVKWISVVLLFWMLDVLVQLGVGHDLFGVAMTADGRAKGPFSGNLRLSLYLSLLLPVLLYWLRPRGLPVVLAAFCAAVAVILFGGARNALVYLLVVAAGFFWHLPGGRQKWLIALALAIVSAVTISLVPALQERMTRFELLKNPTFENIDRVLSYRLTIWDTASNMVADRPLAGVGAGAFQAAYESHSRIPDDIYITGPVRAYHAHQLYVSLAAETGLIGLLSFLVILALAVKWYWTTPPRQRDKAWMFALGLAAYVFPVNSQPVLYQQWLFPVLLLLLAAMLATLDLQGGDKPVP